jgi:TatD DNase family protein
MLIDTHAHLNDKRYKDTAESIIKSLRQDGVKYIVNIGYDRPSSEVSLRLAQKYESVYCALAVHPHSAKDYTEADYDYFKSAACDKKVAAIGEAGLDYYHDFSPREVQREVFLRHIALAGETNLPLVVHIRDAYADAYKIISENTDKLKAGILLHCYSGSAETAKEFLSLGEKSGISVYFAFGGTVTYKNNRTAPEVLRVVPKDRILLETDCPYLTPEPYRGKINLPAYVKEVAARVAEILSVTDEYIARLTTENAKKLFFKIQ